MPETLIADYGGFGLLVVAFIAATIVPLGSEVALVSAIALGVPKVEALVWASVGNCMGVTLNYWLGRLGRSKVGDGAGPGQDATTSDRALARAVRWFERWGKWGLLLSWLPFVGDPLTLVAGVIRVNFLFFVAIAYSVRVLRYWIVVTAVPG